MVVSFVLPILELGGGVIVSLFYFLELGGGVICDGKVAPMS